jgi:ABC-type sugar transport system permease subunit
LRRDKVAYLFIAPLLITYGVFWAWPVIHSLALSFTSGQGFTGRQFAGLSNYAFLFSDKLFWKSLGNSLYYSAGILLIQVSLSFCFALIFNNWRFENLSRTSLFLPVLLPTVAVSIIFGYVLGDKYGLLNSLLRMVGITGPSWLRDPKVAMLSLILINTWRWTGYNMVYFLAGLQSVPKELEEAALIDGASAWQKTLYVTIPLLKPVIAFVLITSFIGSFQEFDMPYLLTEGGPSYRTLTIALYLYRTAFTTFNVGYGSTLAYAITLIALTVSLIQLRLFESEK